MTSDSLRGEGTVCPLCGKRFIRGERACAPCPLSGGCDIVCCPHCGYTFPRSSRIVSWIGRLARRVAAPKEMP
jgi:hypothetical protein